MARYYVSLALSCCGKQGEKSLTSAPSPHFFFFFWLALLTSSPSPPSLRPPRTCSPSSPRFLLPCCPLAIGRRTLEPASFQHESIECSFIQGNSIMRCGSPIE